MVEYKYDGYGNIISIIDTTTNNIGEKNPYRYRSYYFDTETSWYYRNSRYYDSSIGRFITMDEVEYLGVTDTIFSYNLYSYCEGNPVNRVDYTGSTPFIIFLIIVLGSLNVWVTTAVVVSYTNDDEGPENEKEEDMSREELPEFTPNPNPKPSKSSKNTVGRGGGGRHTSTIASEMANAYDITEEYKNYVMGRAEQKYRNNLFNNFELMG